MKAISIFVYALAFAPFSSMGQNDEQVSILTDKGFFTVSKTPQGHDMIRLPRVSWDAMVEGTGYISDNLSKVRARNVFIQVADHVKGKCMGGVGFGCSIFARGGKPAPALVNDQNRFAAAIVQLADPFTVRVIFVDRVDWNSLAAGCSGQR